MTTKPFSTIDEYVSAQPESVQAILQELRRVIAKVIPDATETISYNIPTFKQNGTYIVYFSGWKDHVSLYPTPADMALHSELEPYMSGKGTVKFSLAEPIPYELVEKMVKALLAESAGRTGY
jgi:uncharacterized protein YdhG (YjbR/CyaY superfamily)